MMPVVVQWYIKAEVWGGGTAAHLMVEKQNRKEERRGVGLSCYALTPWGHLTGHSPDQVPPLEGSIMSQQLGWRLSF